MKYEYMVLGHPELLNITLTELDNTVFSTVRALNKLGLDRWELCGIEVYDGNYYYYFKRATQ